MKPDNLEHLKLGGVGVIPTDTIYGIVAQAFRPKAVDRIYDIKGRDGNKPFIILISSLDDLRKFKVCLSEEDKVFLLRCWPGAVSVILPVPSPELEYLHRGSKSLAFRLPNKPDLIEIIKEVGPLVAPSANPEGEKPATTISEAKAYFGHSVDFYEDGGTLISEPSTLIRLTKDEVEVIRVGKATVPIHDLEKIETNDKGIAEKEKPQIIVEEKVKLQIVEEEVIERKKTTPAKPYQVNKKVSVDYNRPMTKKEKIFYTILFFTSLLILLICILIRLR